MKPTQAPAHPDRDARGGEDARRPVRRVTRFVMAVWDKRARTWTVEGRTIKGYGADSSALERDIGRVLAVPDGERVRLVEASLEDGVWICVLPSPHILGYFAYTLAEARTRGAEIIARRPMEWRGRRWEAVIAEDGGMTRQ